MRGKWTWTIIIASLLLFLHETERATSLYEGLAWHQDLALRRASSESEEFDSSNAVQNFEKDELASALPQELDLSRRLFTLSSLDSDTYFKGPHLGEVYLVASLVLVLGTAATVEFLGCCARRRAGVTSLPVNDGSYSSLPVIDGDGRGALEQKSSLNPEVRDFQELVSFTYLLASYGWVCCLLVLSALIGGMFHVHRGLPFELYLAWLAMLMSMHLGCGFYMYCSPQPNQLRAQAGDFFWSVLGSPLGSPLDALRVSLAAGVYFASGSMVSRVSSALILISLFAPHLEIIRTPATLRAMRRAMLPIAAFGTQYEEPSSDFGRQEGAPRSGPWWVLLDFLREISDPFTQYILWYCEVPFFLAAALYTWLDGFSFLIGVGAGISVAKLLVVLAVRPFILCWLAQSGRPWQGLSVLDIQRAAACSWACSWRVRTGALCQMLDSSASSVEVKLAGIEALALLFQREGTSHTTDEAAAESDEALLEIEAVFARLLIGAETNAAASQALLQLGVLPEQVQGMEKAAALAATLSSPNVLASAGAAHALAELGPALAGSFAPLLAQLLTSSEPDARQAACTALGALGERFASPYAERIVSLLSDQDAGVVEAAAGVVGLLGPEFGKSCVAQLGLMLRESSREVRAAAANALGDLGGACAGAYAGSVAALLADEEIPVRVAAATALGKLGPLSFDIVTELTTSLSDPNARVKQAGRASLQQLGWTAAVQLALLLESDQEHERSEGLEGLCELGPSRAGPFTGCVVSLMEDKSVDVRAAVAKTLGIMGPSFAGPFVSQLALMLRDSSPFVRQFAARALGSLGNLATPFAEAMSILLADKTPYVREAVGDALVKLGPPATIPIRAQLRSSKPETQAAAARAAGLFAPNGASELIGSLTLLVKEPGAEVKARAVWALGCFGHKHAASSYDTVVTLLEHDSGEVRAAAASALGSWGEDPASAPRAADEVSKLLQDPIEWVRGVASVSLHQLSKGTEGAHLSEIRPALLQCEPAARVHTAEMLFRPFYRKGEATLQVIALLSEDDDPEVQAELQSGIAAALGEQKENIEASELAILKRYLGSEEAQVRNAACAACEKLGVQAVSLAPELASIFANKQEQKGIAQRAHQALARLGREGLQPLLQSSDPSIRGAATRVLESLI